MLTQNMRKCDRKFQWTSSADGDSDTLLALDKYMTWFYSQIEGREPYQKMLDSHKEELPSKSSVTFALISYVCSLKPQSVLEVGCGGGQLYRYLRRWGYSNQYCGLEMAKYIIDKNQQHYPESEWCCGTAYKIPYPDNSFDLCFAHFVLEHLVYPERGLREMLRVLNPGGRLVLVFPDFLESGRFASQQLGFSLGTASQKLRKWRLFDAMVSLYDSRWRLPRELKQAVSRLGAFPVNISPICLSYPDAMSSDVDAVYIASTKEIHDWGTREGYRVEYPSRNYDQPKEIAFLSILKDSN